MVNKVIDGMAEAINGAFGDEVEIYIEPVKQGLVPTSFTIRALDSHIDRFLNNRFKRTCLMEVNYFPADELNPRTEIQSKIEALFNALEVINVGEGKVRGIQADYKIVDDVLVAVVKYVFYTYKIEDKEYMEELTQEINAK